MFLVLSIVRSKFNISASKKHSILSFHFLQSVRLGRICGLGSYLTLTCTIMSYFIVTSWLTFTFLRIADSASIKELRNAQVGIQLMYSTPFSWIA